MAEVKIGEVIKYFSKPQVAAIKITQGELTLGNVIRIVGHTTDITTTVDSMEVENQKVSKAKTGEFVGVKVNDKVRPGDIVYIVLPA